MLDEKLIRRIVKFHESLPEDIRASLTIHPQTDEEYNNVVKLIDKLNMSISNDNPIRIKTLKTKYFNVTFFKP